MGVSKPTVFLCLAAVAVSSAWAAVPSADEVVGTSCSIALDVFAQCNSTSQEDKLSATCCTPYSVLKSFNCFCNPEFSARAQDMMTSDVRQALLQCPGEGHISAPIQCNQDNQQVTLWLAEPEAVGGALADPRGVLFQGSNNKLITAQPEQMPVAQGNLLTDMLMSHYTDSDSTSADSDSSITLDLTVDVGPYGGDRVVRRGVTIGASDFGSSVADLTAEVDFEVGPDVSGNEIKQILQGVTEWVATMVDDNSDPFGDLATFEKSGQMTAITAHVAEVISRMAGTLNGLGANDDMDVEITYEFDLAAPEFRGMAQRGSAQDLSPLRDSMISAASDYAMIDTDESSPHDMHHMGHHHMGPRHKCFIRQTYRWLCRHKELIRVALVVELVLCAVFGMVHLVWSCCISSQHPSEDDSPSDLKVPLIESAAAYAPQGDRVVISPLWAHVMHSKSNVSLV